MNSRRQSTRSKAIKRPTLTKMETLREAETDGDSEGSISPITNAQKPKEFHLQDDEGDTIYTDTELNSEETHRKNRSKCNHEKIVANKSGANNFREEDTQSDESEENEDMPIGANSDNIERQNSWSDPEKKNPSDTQYEATNYGTNDQLINTQADSSNIEQLAQDIDELGNCRNEVKRKISFEEGITNQSTQQPITARRSPGDLTQSLLTQDRKILNDHFPDQTRKDLDRRSPSPVRKPEIGNNNTNEEDEQSPSEETTNRYI